MRQFLPTSLKLLGVLSLLNLSVPATFAQNVFDDTGAAKEQAPQTQPKPAAQNASTSSASTPSSPATAPQPAAPAQQTGPPAATTSPADIEKAAPSDGSKKKPSKGAAPTKSARAKAAKNGLSPEQFLDSAAGGTANAPAGPQAIRPPGNRNLGHFPWLVQQNANRSYRRVAPGGRVGKPQPGHYIRPEHVPLPNPYPTVANAHPVRKKASKQAATRFVPTLMYDIPYNKLPEGGYLKTPAQQASADKK